MDVKHLIEETTLAASIASTAATTIVVVAPIYNGSNIVDYVWIWISLEIIRVHEADSRQVRANPASTSIVTIPTETAVVTENTVSTKTW